MSPVDVAYSNPLGGTAATESYYDLVAVAKPPDTDVRLISDGTPHFGLSSEAP